MNKCLDNCKTCVAHVSEVFVNIIFIILAEARLELKVWLSAMCALEDSLSKNVLNISI